MPVGYCALREARQKQSARVQLQCRGSRAAGGRDVCLLLRSACACDEDRLRDDG